MTASGETPARPPRLRPAPAGLCLVTGASGFIGGHVARRLRRDGYPVRCLVRPTSDVSGLEGLDVEFVSGDLSDRGALGRATEGCQHVLHCAALVSDWATVKEIRQSNVRGTRNLVEASVAAGVERFVHLSTTDIYGYPGDREVDETRPPGRFHNWYAQTKLEAEHELGRGEQIGGLAAVILRAATVYGPGSREVVGEIAKALCGGHMLMIDRGRAVAGLTYVENLVDAAILALSHHAAPGQAFNVTDGIEITWREFLNDLADGLGCRRPRWSLPYPVATGLGFALEHGYRALRHTTRLKTGPLLSRQAVGVLGRPQNFSNRKARALLGWEPRVGYSAGLEATLDWLTIRRSAAVPRSADPT